MLLKGFAMARSIDNFCAHFFHYLYLKYAYESVVYRQKTSKLLIAFYAEFSMKSLSDFYLIGCRI